MSNVCQMLFSGDNAAGTAAVYSHLSIWCRYTSNPHTSSYGGAYSSTGKLCLAFLAYFPHFEE
jgi:hypothetical protein